MARQASPTTSAIHDQRRANAKHTNGIVAAAPIATAT